MRRYYLFFVVVASLIMYSCTVEVDDFTFCSLPWPIPAPEFFFSACDNFLTKNQQGLDWNAFSALLDTWVKKGYVIELTTDQAVANLKKSIEKLCTNNGCDYVTQQKLEALKAQVQQMLDLGEKTRQIQNHFKGGRY